MSNTPFSPGWDLERSPFHEGELAIQERVGVREKIDAQGRRAARRYLTEQHREFFRMLPYLFVGSVDDQGQPWASPLFGAPGFVMPTDDTSISVRARPLHGDPLATALREGAEIAMLGAQLHTRRRNRLFGSIAELRPDGFAVAVRQTLGICPQYIQGREPEFTRDPSLSAARPVHRSDRLDAGAQSIIAHADTYFVASVNPREADGVARGADVSHRGGRPGFVRVDDAATLTAPDFVGNFIFNTLGNWQIDNRAGLLFLDFQGGDLVYVAARAEVIWEGPELRAFTGAQRLVRYHIEQVIRVEDSLPARFTAPEDSSLLVRTGSWAEVARTLDAERNRNEWRPFRIARIETESDSIRSFYLEPTDGRGLASHAAGQFLPLRVTLPGWDQPATRTYTLSAAAGAPTYRISVKREGKGGVSAWLHDSARVGDAIKAMNPRGDFTFDADPRRPAVLISAGVGITPFVAMLDSLLINDGRTRHHAPIWFVHGARNSAAHAFGPYLKTKAQQNPTLRTHIRYSQPLASDRVGKTHDSVGTVDVELLKAILPFDDYEFYLCGPAALMQKLYDGLTDLGVRDERIHFERFGPASVTRKTQSLSASSTMEEAVVVKFAKSGKEALWCPDQGSLLDLAERTGVAPLSSCRAGICGTCATKLLEGAVDYAQPPGHEIGEGDALICVATPHPGPHLDDSIQREGVTLDL
jgi:ferredoxin-NADP reductase/predicted pyridoxine 5'-phosphate oxidase superfamily flavin-nucleotide-binding protein